MPLYIILSHENECSLTEDQIALISNINNIKNTHYTLLTVDASHVFRKGNLTHGRILTAVASVRFFT